MDKSVIANDSIEPQIKCKVCGELPKLITVFRTPGYLYECPCGKLSSIFPASTKAEAAKKWDHNEIDSIEIKSLI